MSKIKDLLLDEQQKGEAMQTDEYMEHELHQHFKPYWYRNIDKCSECFREWQELKERNAQRLKEATVGRYSGDMDYSRSDLF